MEWAASATVRSVDRGRRMGLQPSPLWYKDAIIYELRTRSYYDVNDDGVGDLRGLTAKLDYLADLGVTAIWILPHYPSPGRDDGYDIADYTNIHPAVGSLDDFDELVKAAHRRGMRIITELVINHTSDQHPWFQRARRAAPGSVERNFYVWSDTASEYASARIIFGESEPSNWTWDPVAKAYFWHRFFSHQPDLNFDNPAVHASVFGVVDFWLARGVDGLRLDAVPYLYEREGTSCENLPQTHAFLKRLRARVDARFEGRMLLAEANQWPEDAARYFGDGDECHMAFHFPLMPRLFMAIHMEDRFPIIDILQQTPSLGLNCQWAMFLRNHDELTLEMVSDEERDYMYRAYGSEPQARLNLGIRRRLAPLCSNDRRKMELLDALLFSMPGTPVLYYGDEIGMGDNVYLGDRNGVRTPMQWSPDRNAGFSRSNPQRLDLPVIIDPEYHYETLNVEAQQSNPSSLLWWTKRLIALRKRFHALGRGSVEFLNASNPCVLAFIRRYQDEVILVVANLSRRVQYVELELQAMKGMVPVELMGQTRFPTIGDAPYLLTLGGHNFYWLKLEAGSRPSLGEQRGRRSAPTLAITSPQELLFGSERSELESMLPQFLEMRGWFTGTLTRVRIVETVRIEDVPPAFLVFMRAQYDEGGSDTFMIPLLVLTFDPELAQFVGQAATSSADALVAYLTLKDSPATLPSFLLVFAASEGEGRILLDAIASGAKLRTRSGAIVAATTPGVSFAGEPGQAHILSSDPRGVSIAYGTNLVLRLFNCSEEGSAPELEAARFFEQHGLTVHMPRVLGWVEYRAANQAPATLAVVEEQVAHQGTAWQQARGDLERAYERILAHPMQEPLPAVPREPLIALARVEPPAAHAELIGAYRAWAAKLGARVAEFHLALSSSREPAFEPRMYSPLDQRSKYQTGRSLMGRVLGLLRRSLGELPAPMRVLAERVLSSEAQILARFEPLKTQSIDARRIRIHGRLHLGRVLFTGKDYVLLGFGGARGRRLSERRRKASALRDVASVVRSFQYVAAASLSSVRPQDQARAEPSSLIWARWASAAFLQGYLNTAGNAPFVSRHPAVNSVLLETALLDQTFRELEVELRHPTASVAIPLYGILDLIGRT